MAGATQEEQHPAQCRRARPGPVRESTVVHGAQGRHGGMQEHPLPETVRGRGGAVGSIHAICLGLAVQALTPSAQKLTNPGRAAGKETQVLRLRHRSAMTPLRMTILSEWFT